MAATKFVVNYDAATGKVRSITVFPEDHEHDGHLSCVLVGPDEKQIHLPMEMYGNHIQVQEHLDLMIGSQS